MKAIIPAAGLGTRFLPETKAIPKEMFVLVDRPVIQYIVEEALAADVDEVVIVNSPDKKVIEQYFAKDAEMVMYLRAHGKDAYADAVEHAGDLPVDYVYQGDPLGLGHAVSCAAKKTGDKPFFVLLGDVVVPGCDILPRMREVSEAHSGASVIAVMPVADDQVDRFGIIDGQDLGDGVWKISHLVEKPKLEDAPSHLAIFGRYLLTPAVMDLLGDSGEGVGGEIQLTDALESLLSSEEMYALVVDPATGFDTGTVDTWLDAEVALTLRDPDLGPKVADRLKERLAQA